MIRSNKASVSGAAQILRREKAEAAEGPEGSGKLGPVLSGDRLSCIFNDDQIVSTCDVQYGIHVGGKTKQVYGQDGACFRSDGSFDQLGIDIKGQRINIHKYGLCANQGNGGACSNEAKRSSDDLVAGSNFSGHQRQNECVRAGRATDGEFGTELGRDFVFKLLDLRAKDEMLALHHARNGTHNLIPDGAKLRSQVQKIKIRFRGG